MDIPKFLEHLPVFTGFPVPHTVIWVDGKPDFRVPDGLKVAQCLADNLCGICGRKLGDFCYLIGGDLTAQSRFFVDPPMHKQCAEFSMRTCPFLNGKREGYSNRPVTAPEHHTIVVKEMSDKRPDVMYIFKVRTKKVGVTREGYITVPNFAGRKEYR